MLGLLLSFFGIYSLFAYHAPPAHLLWLFDWIDNFQLLSIDDAYRYFSIRGAWTNGALWHWYYVQPANLLFEGMLNSLFRGAVFPMRLGHVALTLAGVFFVYLCALELGVRKWIAVLSGFSLLAMPLFAVVGMSFYGESLLAALLAMASYCHLKGYRYGFVFFAALVPLAQRQGLVFLLPFLMWYALRRDWKMVLFLVLPGFVYFLNIIWHESLIEYFSILQLHKLYPALPVEAQARPWWSTLVLLNPVFCGAALLGALFFHRSARWRPAFLPVFWGGVLWLLLDCFVLSPLNSYEPRYIVPSLPAFILGYGLFCEAVCARLQLWQKGGRALPVLLVVGVTSLLCIENLGQSDPLRNLVLDGRRWPMAGVTPRGVDRFYRVVSHSVPLGKDVASRISNFLHEHDRVNLLMVSNFRLLYFLDPEVLPAGVRVCYSPFEARDVYLAYGGSYFCMSDKEPQVAFYHFYPSHGEQTRAVVVGDFSSQGWKPAYQNAHFKVYEASYRIVAPPGKMRIHYREERMKQLPTPAKGNLCPELEGYICPDWRILGFEYNPGYESGVGEGSK